MTTNEELAALRMLNKPLDFTKPIRTRKGFKVEIYTTSRMHENYPVVGAIKMPNSRDDIIGTWTLAGLSIDGQVSVNDLVNVLEKKEGWANLYRCHESSKTYIGNKIFTSQGDAEQSGRLSRDYITTTHITWEE
jgi:hypothetical protein